MTDMRDPVAAALQRADWLAQAVLSDDECGDGFRLSNSDGHDCYEFERMRLAQQVRESVRAALASLEAGTA